MRKYKPNNITNGIGGLNMIPLATTESAFKKILKSSTYHVTKDFLKSYNNHIGGMSIVAMSAKLYIKENWKNVKSWTELNVYVTSNTISQDFYNYTESKLIRRTKSTAFDRMLSGINRRNKNRHNPIKRVSKVYLDVDWDLSMNINGKLFIAIDEESSVIIASFIEKKILEQREAIKQLKKRGAVVLNHK